MTTSEKIASDIARQNEEIRSLVSRYMSKKMRTVKSRQEFFKSIGGKTNSEGKLLISR
jgi:hypothetical protein